MPRLAFEEPKGQPGPKHHRREDRKRRDRPGDRVVLILKTATFAVAALLIGAVVLLITTGNGTKDVADTSPAVPEIDAPGSRDDSPTTTTSTTPVLAPPIVGSQTAQVVPELPPATTTTPPPPPPTTPGDDEPEFAVIGEPCKRPGSFSFTVEYEPVVCSNDRPGQKPTWHRMF
jgi:hypothetical protein